jgi:hypothetical protein
MGTFAIIVLFVFGVMGFGVNLLYRIIFVYEKKQEGQQINWWWETFLTLAVPLTVIFAIAEVMYIFGWFSSPDQRFY